MAKLIQFKSSPHRHHALYKEHVLAINRTISEEEQRRRITFPLMHFEFEEQKNALIKAYLIDLKQARADAFIAAKKCSTRRLAASIIVLLYRWHQNIEREVKAMLKVSYKIAETILNTSDLNNNITVENGIIHQQLKKYFNIIILFPSTIQTAGFGISTNLEHYFAQLPFLTTDHHDKDLQLKICWQEETRILALDPNDLSWILDRAIKNIIKIKQNYNEA